MASRIDKSRLEQDKKIEKSRKMGISKTAFMKGTKIKGEMEKDTARLKSIQESQKAADKSFKAKQKQSKIGERPDDEFVKSLLKKSNGKKDYVNSKNKLKMLMPRLGALPKELGIKGGAGPTGKRLKRI